MTKSALTSDKMVEASGEDLDIHIASSATIKVRIRIQGQRNKLVVEDGVVIGPATSASDPEDPAVLIIDGEDNLVVLGQGAVLGLRLIVRGNGHRVDIGARSILRGRANLFGERASLLIGESTTMVDGSLQLHEPGEVRIGKDCMISSQVYVSLSDMHPIHDRSNGKRINPAASVSIGDHVWLGLRCMVLKGARIGDGAVLAAGAIVSGKVSSHAVAAGVPARVVRENIEWRREFGPNKAAATALSQAKRKHWGLF